MKVIIQIPCYNEAEQIAATIQSLPRTLPGVDEVAILIVDDGSTDGTASVAEKAGADHIERLPQHRGLACAFAAGFNACLALGADIIINTDADNQYPAEAIPSLMEPLLTGRAQIVIGDRGIGTLHYFSPLKRLLQRLGSRVISQAAGIPIPDATSGFRAYVREAAMRTIILSTFTFTLETLIQAGANGIPVVFVPVNVNAPTRSSRLIRSMLHYLLLSGATIVRFYSMYSPLRVFSILGCVFFLAGVALSVRFIYFLFVLQQGSGHVQSLILAAVMLILGIQILLIGLLADLISANRKILEETLYRIKGLEYEQARIKSLSSYNKTNPKSR